MMIWKSMSCCLRHAAGLRTVLAALALLLRATALSAAEASRDVTFIATSDVHYDAFENEDRNERVRDTLRYINTATNLAWPAVLGGDPIGGPRGVLVLGDVIDDGDRVFQGKHQAPRQWHQFAADFGFDGTDGLLNFRVFETWGNHDGPPVGAEKFGFSFQARLKERNLRRQEQGWLANLSTNGLHYSWDWDDVHFVMLGLYPADRQNSLVPRYSPVWHDPQDALQFLKSDLARCVGASDRPVVLLSHCGFDTDWWHTNDWRAAYDAAKSYHVVLYLYGHTGTGVRTWAPPGETAAWQCLNTGQTENGFFVVQLAGDRLRAAYRRKHWLEEKLADGTSKRVWDGTWEWHHLLDKPLARAGTSLGPPDSTAAPSVASPRPKPNSASNP
jgi:cytolysin (calcineurin-like family phosphatase)